MDYATELTTVDGANRSSARGGAAQVPVDAARAVASAGGTARAAEGGAWPGAHPPPAADPRAGAAIGPPAGAPADPLGRVATARAVADPLSGAAWEQESPRWRPAEFETESARTVIRDCELGAPDPMCGSDLPHVLAAAVRALGHHPELNARWEDGEPVPQPRVDVGLMLSTPEGPAIPVVHDAGGLWGPELGEVVSRLVRDATQGRLRPGDFGRSSFSVAPAPRVGALLRAPLMRSPEVAILGVCRVHEHPQSDGWVRRSARLACTFDSRAVAESAAREFLDELCAQLSETREVYGGAPSPGFGFGLCLGAGPVRRVAPAPRR